MSISRTKGIVILAILGAVLACVAAFVNSVFLLSALVLLGGIIFLLLNLEFGVLLLVFFFPYLGLVIDFSQFEIFREVPYLKDINAPFIDLFGLVLFVAWLLHTVISTAAKRSGEISSHASGKVWDPSTRLGMTLMRQLPHLKSYLFFWLSGLVSLSNVFPLFFKTSIKYFARPFTFFYIAFFAPVVSVIAGARGQGLGSSLLDRALMVFYATGLLSALNGLAGLFFGAHSDFFRATPFGFFGVNPLGPNHNLLAETLIATAPAGLLLIGGSTAMAGQAGGRGQVLGKWIKYGMFFQWTVALFTFARTAWIAIAIQAMLYGWCTYRGEVKRVWRRVWPVALILGILLIPLVLSTFSETVRGSTLSRLDQVRIASFYFWRSPWIGQGIGTFIPTLWQTRAFLLEYGEPLEAHGIVFKLMFEQGLLGLATFGVFVGAILWKIKKSGNVSALLIAVGSLTYQLFNTTYYTSKLWIPMAIAVSIAIVYENSHHNSTLVS